MNTGVFKVSFAYADGLAARGSRLSRETHAELMVCLS